MNTFHNDLMDSLLCPSCKSYVRIPTAVCANGHSICNVCRPNLENCPECNGIFIRSAKSAPEGLVRSTTCPGNEIRGPRIIFEATIRQQRHYLKKGREFVAIPKRHCRHRHKDTMGYRLASRIIKSQMKCVACSKDGETSLTMCENDHCICADCKARLSKCPCCDTGYESKTVVFLNRYKGEMAANMIGAANMDPK